MADMTEFDVILSRRWGLDVDGLYVYRAARLPAEGSEIVIENKHTGATLSATVTDIFPDGPYPVHADEM